MRWLALGVLAACGARTPLDGAPPRDASVADVSAADVVTLPPPETCAPLAIQQGGNVEGSFTMVGGVLYYKANTGMMMVAWNEATPTHVALGVADAFGVDGTSLFWVDNLGHVSTAPIAGGSVTQGACGAPQSCPPTIYTGSSVVGVTAAHVITVDRTNYLFALPKDDIQTNPKLLVTDGPPTAEVVAAASGGEHAFWITDEYVFEVEVGVTTSVTVDDGWPSGLATHAGDVYWTAAPHGTMRLVHRAVSGGPTNVVFTGDFHGPLAANDHFVYGLSAAGIVRVDVSTGTSTVIAPNAHPKHLQVYGACVFVMDADGAVRRIAG